MRPFNRHIASSHVEQLLTADPTSIPNHNYLPLPDAVPIPQRYDNHVRGIHLERHILFQHLIQV